MKTTLVRIHADGRRMRVGEAAARVKAGLPIAEFDDLRELLGTTVEGLARRILIRRLEYGVYN